VLTALQTCRHHKHTTHNKYTHNKYTHTHPNTHTHQHGTYRGRATCKDGHTCFIARLSGDVTHTNTHTYTHLHTHQINTICTPHTYTHTNTHREVWNTSGR